MAEKTGRSTRRRRTAGSRGALKRSSTVESVIVEEPFSFSLPKDAAELARDISDSSRNENGDSLKAGEACYVSATVHNRRYYGVLVDQASLRAASLLYFHDEASSLDLNRRMKMLADQRQDNDMPNGENAAGEMEGNQRKRQRTEDKPKPDPRPVQKFRFVGPQKGRGADSGYRVLLATYADVIAASEDNEEKIEKIEKACASGGDFVGEYYYQYEVLGSSLEFSKAEKRTDTGFRTSMGFQSFLHNTRLPIWFPLSNLESGQHKVLNILNMKKNSKGKVEFEKGPASASVAGGETIQGTARSIAPRTCFRIGVVGAGIAGLSTALELLRQSEQEKVDLEVTLFEGRSRIGGRILTDKETFKQADGRAFPVDLGASWIHGIDHNPLAALAKEAGADFVTASEDVKMFRSNMGGVDEDVDENIGKIFDDLLDKAAEDCWDKVDYIPHSVRNQKAVRWYASVLGDSPDTGSNSKVTTAERKNPVATDAPQHRFASDVSIDHAIGNVISKRKKRVFSKMSTMENALLLWNTKNIEYALGANISDLSMKYWDADDRHAFEGDHVLIRQGYSSVVRYVLQKLKQYGDKFKCILDFPVGKIEYALKSQSLPYPDRFPRSRKAIELSEKCCVTSQTGSQHHFDFVVCALPLGVLKESVQTQTESSLSAKVIFQPPLPMSKVDAIENVGFGLLNKVFLQFPVAFWRLASALDEDQILFGNLSGLNPHHYMFFDVGKSLFSSDEAPAILMTLISGTEAAESEFMSEDELVNDVMCTLRYIFSNVEVPDPVARKTTRWGSDQFSRGCYTFLPPGTTDQDFHILQSPVNGNGDSLLLDRSETMRLFWAGEHTTALHPSMSHGALLSGIRAAREVMAAMHVDYTEYGLDRLIPLPLFRFNNPSLPLRCSLCDRVGSGAREGALLAFQRGSRQVLVHASCAENSPEVEVKDGKWKHVIKAVNRGKQIRCSQCGRMGATMGCTDETCFRSFHFTCCEDTGWRFHKDGKVFYCDLHRSKSSLRESLRTDVAPKVGAECDRISVAFFRSKNPSAVVKCAYCGVPGDDKKRGKLFGFQRNRYRILVHENCLRHTNVVDTTLGTENEGQEEFKNVFVALSSSRRCSDCGNEGATVKCAESVCHRYFHFLCGGWNYRKRQELFKCDHHREERRVGPVAELNGSADSSKTFPGGLFQHALLFQSAETQVHQSGSGDATGAGQARVHLPSNARSSTPLMPLHVNGSAEHDARARESDDSDSSDEAGNTDILDCRLSFSGEIGERNTEIVRMHRSSLREPWGVSFALDEGDLMAETHLIINCGEHGDSTHGFKDGDRVVAIDGKKVGSAHIASLRNVLSAMSGALDVVIEVARGPVEFFC